MWEVCPLHDFWMSALQTSEEYPPSCHQDVPLDLDDFLKILALAGGCDTTCHYNPATSLTLSFTYNHYHLPQPPSLSVLCAARRLTTTTTLGHHRLLLDRLRGLSPTTGLLSLPTTTPDAQFPSSFMPRVLHPLPPTVYAHLYIYLTDIPSF
ncbi:hypothetical protein BDZ97DRAFT_1855411 [Flammula alnicola]|nr:hypothetical protein BDZ97DRAFT_1855411 [Flammula alnicola]